jgi:L-asparaginase II
MPNDLVLPPPLPRVQLPMQRRRMFRSRWLPCDAVDAVHYGSIAVVDRDGNLLHAAGDPAFLTMTRSALKPFQAMPFVADGGVERFHYTQAQVALLCASHSGEPRHVDAVAGMLAAAGNTAADLQCGTHAPGFYDVR